MDDLEAILSRDYLSCICAFTSLQLAICMLGSLELKSALPLHLITRSANIIIMEDIPLGNSIK